MFVIKKGDKFNKLTAIKFIEKRNSQQYWLFICDCGIEKVIRVENVKIGHTKSCGCLQKEIKHGMIKTRVYKSWQSMKDRCLNKNNPAYKNYGDRGITICDEWLDFENFLKDMGERLKGKSIDRINNNGNYCKENCQWATQKEQNNNTRTNIFLTYKNKTQTMSQWAKELKINRHTLYWRIRNGWDIKRAFNYID